MIGSAFARSRPMMAGAAFGRSRPMMAGAGRADAAWALTKWWKAHTPDNGLVMRTLSPYEQQPVMPWMKTWPQAAYTKFVRSVPYWGTSFFIVWATVEITDAIDAQESMDHRF